MPTVADHVHGSECDHARHGQLEGERRGREGTNAFDCMPVGKLSIETQPLREVRGGDPQSARPGQPVEPS